MKLPFVLLFTYIRWLAIPVAFIGVVLAVKKFMERFREARTPDWAYVGELAEKILELQKTIRETDDGIMQISMSDPEILTQEFHVQYPGTHGKRTIGLPIDGRNQQTQGILTAMEAQREEARAAQWGLICELSAYCMDVQRGQVVYEDEEIDIVETAAEEVRERAREKKKPESLDEAALIRGTNLKISQTLRNFGIDVISQGTQIAPSVIRFKFRLTAGIGIKKVKNQSEDIALALGTDKVSIVPVTGQENVFAVDVPRPNPRKVLTKDLISAIPNDAPPLTVALGLGMNGEAVIADIAEMPHLLIAGTTGAGKSVFLNSLIVSLLSRNAGSELRFYMIDPKRVELTPYKDIPHLLTYIAVEPEDAVEHLEAAVREMDGRYSLMQAAGVKDIEEYNQTTSQTPMYHIVVIIDELADLMMVSKKEVETPIIRIAQKGRAAGIHLVAATQRPSADVITGLIKANIPSRIAFAVASSMESRIILDENGAENLVGKGDMLYCTPGKPAQRIQGGFIDGKEIKKAAKNAWNASKR